MSRLLIGDCRESMRSLIAEGVKVQMCVTSPPYWGLRDYGVDGQLGLEPTIDEFVANMVGVFRLVRDLLKDDGTLWLNLGDSYAGSNQTGGTNSKETGRRQERMIADRNKGSVPAGLKAKDLCGIPWRVAFALQADGWWLRQDISVWTIPTQGYPEAHFATYPPALIEPCILAGSRPGDVVFDPFFGSGTTGEVAQRLGREWLGCELNPEYGKLAERRTSGTIGMALSHEAA